MNGIPKIIISSGKDNALKRFHPWVFSGAIKKIAGEVHEGDVVEVYSNQNEYLGTGHYQEGSISVRIFSFKQINPDKQFWKSKIENAYEYRKSIGIIGKEDTNVYRLVFGEGDGLPGLVMDYYNGSIVFQAHSIGMHKEREHITEALKEGLWR